MKLIAKKVTLTSVYILPVTGEKLARIEDKISVRVTSSIFLVSVPFIDRGQAADGRRCRNLLGDHNIPKRKACQDYLLTLSPGKAAFS